jgi:hypothetical protein
MPEKGADPQDNSSDVNNPSARNDSTASSSRELSELIVMQVRTKLDRYDVEIAEPPTESLGIMFEGYSGVEEYPYAMQVEGVVRKSIADKFGTITARDLLVAINDTQLASKEFPEVSKLLRASLDPDAKWPCKLQFLQHNAHYEVELSTSGSLGLGLNGIRGEFEIEVERIVEETAASATRIVPGDMLTSINSVPLAGLVFKECASVLTREKGQGEMIKLGFLHKNNTAKPKVADLAKPNRGMRGAASRGLRGEEEDKAQGISLHQEDKPRTKLSFFRTLVMAAFIMAILAVGPLKGMVQQARIRLRHNWEEAGGWGLVHDIMFPSPGEGEL